MLYSSSKNKKKNNAAVIIISHKPELLDYEEKSIIQCSKVLRNRDIFFTLPKNIDRTYYHKTFPSIKHFLVNPKWLSSYEYSNHFKVLPYIYNTFSQYEFILFHEPDAYVFEDELDFWIEKSYDYIGAPWFKGYEDVHEDSNIIGVGNSGFSLRKVSSHLKVTRSFSYIKKKREIYNENLEKFQSLGGKLYGLYSTFKQLTYSNNTHYLFNNYMGQEDLFWAKYVPRNFSWFKVAPVEDAIRFSFEIFPERLFEMNEKKLPFGCHAWQKYNPEFWSKFIS